MIRKVAMRFSTRLLISGVLSVGVVLAGCSSPETGSEHVGSDDHVRIDPLDPTQLGAEDTATTAMGAILSWQPAVDESKSDALRRARPWLGGDLAVAVDQATGPAPTLRPDQEWLAWRESGAAVSASCTRADSTPAAPEGMRTVVIDVTCTQTVLHAAGSSTPRAPETWRTTATRTDDGWRLTGFRYQQ
ncbi:hypothetical protein [Rhodococcus marinonascens]|uniref:hypothetical protein n=1 Tax=Rhodococcus marinonascens TaxID=38311 RepID=UPI000AC3C8ED|nr:hypothetical protein [Rhodococcus marinonascens]